MTNVYKDAVLNGIKELEGKEDLKDKEITNILLADLSLALSFIADELRDINKERKVRAMYELGMISKTELNEILSDCVYDVRKGDTK